MVPLPERRASQPSRHGMVAHHTVSFFSCRGWQGYGEMSGLGTRHTPPHHPCGDSMTVCGTVRNLTMADHAI